MSVLIVGSIAIDTVKTPVEEHSDLLGGSASYAALAASFFSPVRLVGIVGNDFPKSEFDFWRSRKIDTEGVQRVNGKTFRWSGEYSWDLNTRQTRSIDLNVFKDFKPELPETYRQTDFVLLANIAPSLQAHVLEQMERPRFVIADTMDLWIETARSDLDALLRRVDLLILNDSEAREMTKETSLNQGRTAYSEDGARRTLPSKKVSTARCSLAKAIASSVAARTHSKTFMIQPEQGTRSPAAWPAISRAR